LAKYAKRIQQVNELVIICETKGLVLKDYTLRKEGKQMDHKFKIDKIDQRLDEVQQRVKRLENKVFRNIDVEATYDRPKCEYCQFPVKQGMRYCKKCAGILGVEE
jgi:hypothetical protein